MTPRRQRVVVAVAALVAAAATARLGVWQLDRAQQKMVAQSTLEERAQMPPIATDALLARDATVAATQQHRRVQLPGRWDALHTVYLDNRQMNGRPGFYVVTPFVLADGTAVAVQRGWLARNFIDRAQVPTVPTGEGAVTLAGSIAPPPSRLLEFDAGQGGRIRQNLDLEAYARETTLVLRPLSVLLSDSPAAAGDGLQREWPAPSAGAAKNQGYAWQWFGLSALIVILYVWLQLLQPWRRHVAS